MSQKQRAESELKVLMRAVQDFQKEVSAFSNAVLVLALVVDKLAVSGSPEHDAILREALGKVRHLAAPLRGIEQQTPGVMKQLRKVMSLAVDPETN